MGHRSHSGLGDDVFAMNVSQVVSKFSEGGPTSLQLLFASAVPSLLELDSLYESPTASWSDSLVPTTVSDSGCGVGSPAGARSDVETVVSLPSGKCTREDRGLASNISISSHTGSCLLRTNFLRRTLPGVTNQEGSEVPSLDLRGKGKNRS